LTLLHQGPLFVDHLVGIRSGESLDVRTFGLREAMGQPEDLGHGVGLLLDRYTGRVVFLPHGDNYERNEHSVDHAKGRVDEAGHVIVSLAQGGGNEALHHLETGERDEASPTDHKYAIDYGE
jgi:hypothetical protein